MPTEFPYKRNVKILCLLQVGDIVRTDGWGPKLDGKDHVVEDLKLQLGCESGVLVKIAGHDGYLDSGWLIKQSIP